MNYKTILNEIQPTTKEKEQIHTLSNNLIKYLNRILKEQNINAEALLVGSVAKNTFLRGKSDIDIFINFPLSTPMDQLKELGLKLGYQCSEEFNGKAEEHYASHPYLTSCIDGYDIDFVPCYKIKSAKQLKSAVDRTLLHTKYITYHLKEEQKSEVLLLKKFMSEIKTYGSEFKVGGFAGYLCELLILKYGTFEKLLENAQNWNYGIIIDLEDYGTGKNFNDPLITIDPTDENRNVGAALRLEKMVDFIIASRNFLDETNNDKKSDYFKPLNKKQKISTSEILKKFKDRETHTLLLKFEIPEIPPDSLHPQLNKTMESITEKLETKDFSIFKSDYWTDENKLAIFIFELNVYKQSKYIIHEGPKIWSKKSCDNFKNYRGDKLYSIDDLLVLTKERKFKTPESYINYILTNENIHNIKIGKNLKDLIIATYDLDLIENFLSNKNFENYSFKKDFLNFLDDFIYPKQYVKR